MLRAQSAIILIASLFLAACSGMRVVDSDVTAFSAWTSAPPVPGTRYTFERLPSQQSANVQQDRIEALATTSLSKAGMALSPLDARYSVQVLLVTDRVQRYPEPGFGFGGPGIFASGGSRGSSIGLSFPIGFSQPYYKRTVGVVMRELASQKVVFETRAMHDGPWGDTFAVLPAMLDSALLGFPQPPAGTRKINAEIPR
jgi:hypothetical protein